MQVGQAIVHRYYGTGFVSVAKEHPRVNHCTAYFPKEGRAIAVFTTSLWAVPAMSFTHPSQRSNIFKRAAPPMPMHYSAIIKKATRHVKKATAECPLTFADDWLPPRGMCFEGSKPDVLTVVFDDPNTPTKEQTEAALKAWDEAHTEATPELSALESMRKRDDERMPSYFAEHRAKFRESVREGLKGQTTVECKNCKEVFPSREPYCPNCGVYP